MTTLPEKEILDFALARHSQLWKAFAEARMEDIERLCKEGLAESMRQRLSRRSKTDVYRWDMMNPVKAKLVSFKVMLSPLKMGSKTAYMQQAVVRISGQQRLWKGVRNMDNHSKIEQNQSKQDVPWLPEGQRIQPVTELFVLQRMITIPRFDAIDLEKGKIHDWYIWGFAQETTLDNFKEVMQKAKEEELLKNVANRKQLSAA